ncbi:unnamed protein product [Medioppia subpectinata]|uniref:Uncharacterized protein n=1 Tax=Medioppia subpectinata TaxID=1979941 RepID=A0A7R9Q7H8_9ACAR|nr:unnamed protein product [Medioppia subpectinata]CAG2115588.1 unnamed protein product [Medioppia subpectinata]
MMQTICAKPVIVGVNKSNVGSVNGKANAIGVNGRAFGCNGPLDRNDLVCDEYCKSIGNK